MSVAAERSHSPTHFGKRLYEPSEGSPDFQRSPGTKRARTHSSTSSHHSNTPPQEAAAVRASYLVALRGLFPRMEEKVLSDILDACGDNIDAAIKRLGELQLTASCTGAEHKLPPPAQKLEEQHSGRQSGTVSPTKAEGAGADQGPAARPEQAQQGISSGKGVPSTSQEWVEAIVEQMAGSADLAQARVRAASVLQAFEQAVLGQAGGGGEGGGAALRAQLAELSRDNGILKRAVAIQNARLHEAVGARDAEAAGLRGALAQAGAKISALELANYTLSLHLRAATGASRGGLDAQNWRPPDVF